MNSITMSIDDSLRRNRNQAFFEGIHAYEVENTDRVEAEPGEPFDTLLNPNAHAVALAYEARLRASGDVKPADVASLNIDTWVDLPKRFSNTRPALKSLIRRVLKGSEGRGPRGRNSERCDARGPVAKNPAKSQTRLTPEQRAELVADYEAGMPVKAIAAKYRVPRGTIPTFVSRTGGRLRTSGLDDDGRRSAVALYKTGLTLAEVADRLAVDPKTVRDAVVDAGAHIRPRGRQAADVTRPAQT